MQQLSYTYWLYVVWDPLEGPGPTPVTVQNPVKRLDHAKQEMVADRYYDFPANTAENAAVPKNGSADWSDGS